MKLLPAAVTAFAAFGLVLGASAGASACEWYKNDVTAEKASTPAEKQVAMPATAIDPLLLANLDKAAILPSTSVKEEAIDESEAR